MSMSIKIEFRYAILTSLCTLLWLILEYTVGLHDTYIAWHPYVTMLAIIIPIITYRLALIEKLEEKGKLSFKDAFISGLIMTIFATVLAIPIQLIFHKVINPDFFANMINYAVTHGKETLEQAAQYFNLKTYLIESTLGTLLIGIIISLILAFRMRTVK